MYAEWKTRLSVSALLAFSVTASAEALTRRQMNCWSASDIDERVVMLLPISSEELPFVMMSLHGMEYPAFYTPEGLQHRWLIIASESEEH